MTEIHSSVNTTDFMKDLDSVNKLSTAATKLFPVKSQDENLLPDIKDVLITD